MREILLKTARCSWKPWDINEVIEIFLKTMRCSWKPWNINGISGILLKCVRYYWKQRDVPENREILMKLLRYSWKPWDVPENREILLKLLSYYWIPLDITENREMFLKTVRYYWSYWDIFVLHVSSRVMAIVKFVPLVPRDRYRFVGYYRNPWDIAEIREILLKTPISDLTNILEYVLVWRPWDLPFLILCYEHLLML